MTELNCIRTSSEAEGEMKAIALVKTSIDEGKAPL